MKIMVVCEEGFSPKYTGGGGEYINGIYRYIASFDYLKIPKTSLPYIRGTYPFIRILKYIRVRKYLLKNLKKIDQYDIIHNNNVIPFPKMKTTAQLVTTIHYITFKQGFSSRIINAVDDVMSYPLESTMIHNSDYLITSCETVKKKIVGYFSFPEERIKVIPLGVDTELYYPRNLPEENFILFPNALRYPSRKGMYFLLPVLKNLLDEYNLKCIITGNISPDGQRILNSLDTRFRYAGFVNKKRMAELYNKAMMVVFPSLYETYGLVPLETIACGGIVVSANVGAVREYLKNGINGFILPLIREKWAEIMKELIENPALRERIRENNKKEKIRSWEDCAKDHLNFFKEIVEG